MIHVISLGAGVQSTTMALMAAHGEITPMPDCAIFADTGAEPQAVYEHLKWLMSPNVLPFPVHVVQQGNLYHDTVAGLNSTRQRFAAVPWFIRNPDGSDGIGRRQCTSEYKLKPLRKKAREIAGLRKGQRSKAPLVTMWIGISTDETYRAKNSGERWVANRWPLIEARMNRNDCLRWIERNGYPAPPRSACVFCPFHNDGEWRALRDAEGRTGWRMAVEVDRLIRRQPGMKGEQYAHSSRTPLGLVDFSTAEDRGQLNMFNNECEGMCGV